MQLTVMPYAFCKGCNMEETCFLQYKSLHTLVATFRLPSRCNC